MPPDGQAEPKQPQEPNRPVTLDAAKVLFVDPQAAGRSLLEQTLGQIGFRRIKACGGFDEFKSLFESGKPDLVFLDIDAERDAACQIIRGIRNSDIGSNPFVVMVALTDKPELEAVRAALEAGSDDMVVKPVTVEALRQRVTNQIENRKEFIATEDYVGPDRRKDRRELTEDDLASVAVPNTLRHVATGDEAAAPTEERVRETLRNLSTQKFYHLSKKISRVAAQQRDLLGGNSASADCDDAVQEISAALAEIDEIVGEQAFRSVEQVVASTRRALDDIKASGGNPTPRHFELLHAHGGSVTVVLQESEETAGALVKQLEKAVTVVKAKPNAPQKPAEAPAKEADRAPDKAPQPTAPPPPLTKAANPATNGKHPLKVRLRAWWDGVDPGDVGSKANK
ncbi:MAG: response regulator [Kiloniellales bacterium]